jgi:sRNA-binding carbon storage regulator CsrA
VTILEVRQGRVRLGIDAPPAVRIQREEVWIQTPERELAGIISVAPATGLCQA